MKRCSSRSDQPVHIRILSPLAVYNVSKVVSGPLLDAMRVASAKKATLEVKSLTYDRKVSKKLLVPAAALRIRRTAQQKPRPQLGFEPRTSHRLLMETTLSTNLRPLMKPRGSCRVQTSSKSWRKDYRLPFCLTREAYLGRSGKFTLVLARNPASENQIQQNSVR